MVNEPGVTMTSALMLLISELTQSLSISGGNVCIQPKNIMPEATAVASMEVKKTTGAKALRGFRTILVWRWTGLGLRMFHKQQNNSSYLYTTRMY